MANEPSSVNVAVLAEMVRQLRIELNDHKTSTYEELRYIKAEADRNRRLTDEINMTLRYMNDTMNKVEKMTTDFIAISHDQDKNMTASFQGQNKKIDAFINGDEKDGRRKTFIVSILQVVGGIVVALISLWATGKL